MMGPLESPVQVVVKPPVVIFLFIFNNKFAAAFSAVTRSSKKPKKRKGITSALAFFIAEYMILIGMSEKEWFRRLMKEADSWYALPRQR